MSSRIAATLAAVVTVLLATWVAGAEADTPASGIPFVGCPGDGQGGPVAAPTGAPVQVHTAPRIARHLAYYQGRYGPGVLAPRGWQCRLRYGSDGTSVIVTPSVPEAPSIPAVPWEGPGIELVVTDGETSGRFELAAVAARFFPDVIPDFVAAVRADADGNAADFDRKPSPTDTVSRITKRMVECLTPAHREGFGTGSFAVAGRPVRSLVALSLPSEPKRLFVVRVRLPAHLEALGTGIIATEERCLRGRGKPCS